MDVLGWFEEDLIATWKHAFPITQSSIRTGNLPLDHLAWGMTPNPWWKFLTDVPLISEIEAQELNKLRQPLVLAHLDEFGWLVQERKVIDFRGSVTTYLGNFPIVRLFQTLNHVKRCNLLLCYRRKSRES